MSRLDPPSEAPIGAAGDPEGRPGVGRPDPPAPSWMGAPGFTPYPELPPHAPMPGAPPYPGRPVPSPTPVGRPPDAGIGVGGVLAAAAVWGVVDIALMIIVAPGPVALARIGAGVLLSAVLATVVVGATARRRAWSFWVLLVVMAPVYWVLRAVVTAFVG